MLQACSSVGNAPNIAARGALVGLNATTADRLLQSGEVERVVMKGELYPEQVARLVAAFDVYAEARLALKLLIEDEDNLLYSVDIIRSVRYQLQDAYAEAQTVITEAWPTYAPIEQDILLSWQYQMARLNTQYTLLMRDINAEVSSDQRTQLVIQVVRVVGQIALTSL
jgi:hypothetical protein